MEDTYFVIDVHAHVADPSVPGRATEMMKSDLRARKLMIGLFGWQKDVGHTTGMVGVNPTPDNFLKYMGETGTDMAILSTLSFAEELNGMEISSPDFLAGILPRYKGKFLGYAGYDPRKPDAVEKLEYYIREKGFSGAKLNPNDWGVFPLDAPMLMPIYELCQELKVPIHIHTGVDPSGRIEYGNPILLDKVANKYPELIISLEHYGYPYKHEAFAMCRKHENVYMSLAGHFNMLVHQNKLLAWLALEEMRIHGGLEKITYGSDYPATPNCKEVVDFLKYEHVPGVLQDAGMKDWTCEMRAKVLGLNTAGYLKLKNEKIDAVKKAIAIAEPQKDDRSGLRWSPEAEGLRKKIPSFVRDGAIQKIEEYARSHGIATITPEVMEKARNA